MNNGFPQKQNTSEKLKTKQYEAAALICILVAVIMAVIRLIWGNVMLGTGADKIPLGIVFSMCVISCCSLEPLTLFSQFIILCFGAEMDGAARMMITACFLTGKAGSVFGLKFLWF